MSKDKAILVLICGDRNWTDRERIARAISDLPRDACVLHGGARGADTIAGDEAIRQGLDVEAVAAEWRRYGRAAGPIRNQRMLMKAPDLVLYANDNLAESKGTKDMVSRAKAAGIEVRRIR